MSTTKYDPVVRTSKPSSEDEFQVVNAEPKIVEAAPEEQPTDSHVLANANHEEKGAAQLNHGHTEVKDLGWNEHPTDVPVPLVGGLPNEELWTLVRRFNKVSVKRIFERLG
jgi:hypothetical protein